jgi:hypothetical protein
MQMHEFQARVYFNLHKKKLSVQKYENGKGWRVFCHLDYIHMTECVFKVYEAGRLRVLKTGNKNVHAYIIGKVKIFQKDKIFFCNEPKISENEHYRTFRYSPFDGPSFTDPNNNKNVNVASSVIIDLTSEYGNSILYSISNIEDVVCEKCSESTALDSNYSLYGVVHKYGPTTHFFQPKVILKAENV